MGAGHVIRMTLKVTIVFWDEWILTDKVGKSDGQLSISLTARHAKLIAIKV